MFSKCKYTYQIDGCNCETYPTGRSHGNPLDNVRACEIVDYNGMPCIIYQVPQSAHACMLWHEMWECNIARFSLGGFEICHDRQWDDKGYYGRQNPSKLRWCEEDILEWWPNCVFGISQAHMSIPFICQSRHNCLKAYWPYLII